VFGADHHFPAQRGAGEAAHRGHQELLPAHRPGLLRGPGLLREQQLHVLHLPQGVH
ncbi:unnamed protein product, partial [Amoebophrya sp. A120]